MRVFTACLATETNTFSPLPTTRAAFEAAGLRLGADSPNDPGAVSLMLNAVHVVCAEQGADCVEGLSAVAVPGGPVVQSDYKVLRDEWLDALRAAEPVDAVVLILHGAMVADAIPDCEADILQHVRAVVGPDVPIGLVIDPHAHLSPAMVETADIIAAFKKYPHTDTSETARHVCDLTLSTARGEIRPVMAVADCRMVGLWPTVDAPMSGFVNRLRKAEEGVLAASLIHGFPWGDVPHAGAKVLVVADDNAEAAARTATSLRDHFWAERDALALPCRTLEDIVNTSSNGPVVIGDMADNPGGGAPGDATHLLHEAHRLGLRALAIGVFIDPRAVEVARRSGQGSIIRFALGGRHGPVSGKPFIDSWTVTNLKDELTQSAYGSETRFGTSARLMNAQGWDMIVAEHRDQTLDPSVFAAHGIDLPAKAWVIVKSAQHYRASFASIGTCIGADSPGALRHDFAQIPYVHRDLAYWPRVANPFEAAL